MPRLTIICFLMLICFVCWLQRRWWNHLRTTRDDGPHWKIIQHPNMKGFIPLACHSSPDRCHGTQSPDHCVATDTDGHQLQMFGRCMRVLLPWQHLPSPCSLNTVGWNDQHIRSLRLCPWPPLVVTFDLDDPWPLTRGQGPRSGWTHPFFLHLEQ